METMTNTDYIRWALEVANQEYKRNLGLFQAAINTTTQR
jgi:hypothetical protein